MGHTSACLHLHVYLQNDPAAGSLRFRRVVPLYAFIAMCTCTFQPAHCPYFKPSYAGFEATRPLVVWAVPTVNYIGCKIGILWPVAAGAAVYPKLHPFYTALKYELDQCMPHMLSFHMGTKARTIPYVHSIAHVGIQGPSRVTPPHGAWRHISALVGM